MMEWVSKSRYFMRSADGYSVSKTYNGEEWRYSAWPPKPPKGQQHECIDIKNTAEEAIEVCKQHLASTQKNGAKK